MFLFMYSLRAALHDSQLCVFLTPYLFIPGCVGVTQFIVCLKQKGFSLAFFWLISLHKHNVCGLGSCVLHDMLGISSSEDPRGEQTRGRLMSVL